MKYFKHEFVDPEINNIDCLASVCRTVFEEESLEAAIEAISPSDDDIVEEVSEEYYLDFLELLKESYENDVEIFLDAYILVHSSCDTCRNCRTSDIDEMSFEPIPFCSVNKNIVEPVFDCEDYNE